MVVLHGTGPIPLDKRDVSAHRTFGTLSAPYLPDDFSVDIGKTMPDQNADGLYYGCTGYTQSDNLTDQDSTIYKPSYTYDKTCKMEGHDDTTGCQIRTSFKSTQVYGTQALAETTDQEAEQHRGGQYANIYNDGGLDWFDGIRVQIYQHKKGASAGTPWFSSWHSINSTGMMPMPTFDEFKNTDTAPWHNYAIKGWKTINGFAYLMVKSWQGPNIGDKGWLYMPREVANAVFEVRGSGVFIQAPYDPKDASTIKLSILETALDFLYRLIGLRRLN